MYPCAHPRWPGGSPNPARGTRPVASGSRLAAALLLPFTAAAGLVQLHGL